MNQQDFAAKIEWEGGIIDALDYGLKADDLGDQTSALALAWRELETAWQQVKPLIEKVEALLPDEDDESGDGE